MTGVQTCALRSADSRPRSVYDAYRTLAGQQAPEGIGFHPHLLSRGHIHLDKPAGESLPQFRRILDSARRQSLLVRRRSSEHEAIRFISDFTDLKGWR